MASSSSSSKGGRRGLRAVFAAAALVGTYYVMAPAEQSLGPDNDFGPNPVQQEFIRLVAQKYDYTLLGDTHHARARIGMFATHKDSVAAMAAGGDTRLFLEAGPGAQKYFDAVAQGSDKPENFSYRWADRNMWLCGADVKEAYNVNFEQSLSQNPDVKFTGVDQRHAAGTDANAAMDSTVFKLAIGVPLVAYQLTYGCVTEKAFIPGAIVLALTGQAEQVFDSLIDDRDTTNQILSYPEKGGTIFYGAGHFGDKEGVIKGLLQERGYSVGHVNVYLDAKDAQNSIEPEENVPASLYVDEGDGDGIHTTTPEMAELHRQAVENVKRGGPAPFPAI
ncbi:MAG: TraB/GumN family protein [Alphaproteobacteria bacterium]|nr:TraB/GumN family protein [Alphaproteobacteria bacterium]MBU0859783.1 TraB/GumN family protein [Alphaproteobacteria bacterium]